MDTRQLEYFVAVADELNFTRAAQRVFAAQSTVSAGIRSLERELGGALFERDPHRVGLTPLGRQMLDAARDTLEAAERMRALADTTGGLRGQLSVGVFTNLTTIDLPGIMGEFHTRHPLVDLRLGPSPSGSTGLAKDVRLGRIDVAFMGLPGRLPDLLYQRLAVSPFVAVLPDSHPLASRPMVMLADLASERWVDAREGFGNRITLDRALEARGIDRRVSTEVSDLGEIPRFVAARLGVAVMPALTVLPAAGTVTVPVGDGIDWVLSAVARPRPSATAQALLGLLAEHFGEPAVMPAVAGTTPQESAGVPRWKA
ncbi:LysR family transcriptional regulator [Leifsonia poae]|uniref:LysR family transcriptional regulator n=1 Tax=Leifsonia poae TaxID=110933 RepID=UPI001CBC11D0|nr:LysR family transcriptional regulator [Leifsonia poae]